MCHKKCVIPAAIITPLPVSGEQYGVNQRCGDIPLEKTVRDLVDKNTAHKVNVAVDNWGIMCSLTRWGEHLEPTPNKEEGVEEDN